MFGCDPEREPTVRPSTSAYPINHVTKRKEQSISTIFQMAGSSLIRFRRYFSSSVGTKLLIGITGLLLFAYLVLHLAGNALIFAGPDVFNEYSHTLISNPLIVPIEIGCCWSSCSTSTRPCAM